MKSIIISDIHNRVEWISDFVERTEYDELIFLGDYFDSFGDSIEKTTKTANWLKSALENYKNTIFLLGNHDMPYRFPYNTWVSCPGWTPMKSNAVNNILTQKDWSKFRLSYYTQGFLLSHAGVLEDIFSHPISGLSVESIEAQCKEALEKASGGLPSVVLSAGRDRGGVISLPGGGITWCDWNSFEPIYGLNQIVGHTIDSFVRSKYIFGSQNWCIDTNNAHIGIIDDGVFSCTLNSVYNDRFMKAWS